jgi:hypothetical protein|tara:strand:- start:4742 stop:4924 length:183 start_codon:yes stop_codon:yes gene_type:complete
MKTHSSIDEKNDEKWNVWFTNEDLETFKGIVVSKIKPSENEIVNAYCSNPDNFKRLGYGR